MGLLLLNLPTYNGLLLLLFLLLKKSDVKMVMRIYFRRNCNCCCCFCLSFINGNFHLVADVAFAVVVVVTLTCYCRCNYKISWAASQLMTGSVSDRDDDDDEFHDEKKKLNAFTTGYIVVTITFTSDIGSRCCSCLLLSRSLLSSVESVARLLNKRC